MRCLVPNKVLSSARSLNRGNPNHKGVVALEKGVVALERGVVVLEIGVVARGIRAWLLWRRACLL